MESVKPGEQREWAIEACEHGLEMVDCAYRQIALWEKKASDDISGLAGRLCRRICDFARPILEAVKDGRLTVAWVNSRLICDLHKNFHYVVLPATTQELHAALFVIHGWWDAYRLSPHEYSVEGKPTAREQAISTATELCSRHKRFLRYRVQADCRDPQVVAEKVHKAFELLVDNYYSSGQATKDFRHLAMSEHWNLPITLYEALESCLSRPFRKPKRARIPSKRPGVVYRISNALMHGSYMTLVYQNSLTQDCYWIEPITNALGAVYGSMFVSSARAFHGQGFLWETEFQKHNERSLDALPRKRDGEPGW